MKRIRSFLAQLALTATQLYTSISILASLITILVFLAVGLALIEGLRTQNFNINSLVLFGIGLAVVSILGGILVIFQIIHERRADKPDDNNVTTETKSIGIRIKVADEDISVETPDTESAIVFLKEFRAGHLGNIAGVSKHRENQKQSPETPDVSDTKEIEK